MRSLATDESKKSIITQRAISIRSVEAFGGFASVDNSFNI